MQTLTQMTFASLLSIAITLTVPPVLGAQVPASAADGPTAAAADGPRAVAADRSESGSVGAITEGPEAGSARAIRAIEDGPEPHSARAIEDRALDTTRVLVRAVSHDAKVIGSNVGGARITVREAESGRVLARGVQEGSTGSTRLLVVEPRTRGESVYGADGAAGFVAELPLEAPTRVEIVAEGPLSTPHATQRASKTLLAVPGVDILGEGVILELNGFTVRLDEPAADGPADAARARAGEPLRLEANVTMLCGCPIEPGGLWDADRLTVLARLVRDGRVVRETELEYAGDTSTFAGSLTPEAPGDAEIQVLAVDVERANTGMVAREVSIAPAADGAAADGP